MKKSTFQLTRPAGGVTGKVDLTELSRVITYNGQDIAGLSTNVLGADTSLSKTLHTCINHNQIFRGQKISDPEKMINDISNGDFEDLYIGDWFELDMPSSIDCVNNNIDGEPDTLTITGVRTKVKIVCAALNWFYGKSYPSIDNGTPFKKHHAIFIPEFSFFNAAMNKTASTTENWVKTLKTAGGSILDFPNYTTKNTGYIGCRLRNTVLPTVESTIIQYNNFLTNHILHHNEGFGCFVNKDATAKFPLYKGITTDKIYCDSGLDLLSEVEVFGTQIWGSSFDVGSSCHQLPFFKLIGNFTMMGTDTFFLRDVASSTAFSFAHYTGASLIDPGFHNASLPHQIRPRFLLG